MRQYTLSVKYVLYKIKSGLKWIREMCRHKTKVHETWTFVEYRDLATPLPPTLRITALCTTFQRNYAQKSYEVCVILHGIFIPSRRYFQYIARASFFSFPKHPIAKRSQTLASDRFTSNFKKREREISTVCFFVHRQKKTEK